MNVQQLIDKLKEFSPEAKVALVFDTIAFDFEAENIYLFEGVVHIDGQGETGPAYAD